MGATDVTGTPEGWQRVARSVVAARSAMGKTRKDLLRKNLTPVVFNHIENGNQLTYSMLTIAALETALKWSHGTVEKILDDKDFVPPSAAPSDLEQRVSHLEETTAELRSLIDARRQREDAVDDRVRRLLEVLAIDPQQG